jgi:hypothetical protein
MAITCEDHRKPDPSPIPSKPEVMRKVECNRIGALRSERGEAPEKPASGKSVGRVVGKPSKWNGPTGSLRHIGGMGVTRQVGVPCRAVTAGRVRGSNLPHAGLGQLRGAAPVYSCPGALTGCPTIAARGNPAEEHRRDHPPASPSNYDVYRRDVRSRANRCFPLPITCVGRFG